MSDDASAAILAWQQGDEQAVHALFIQYYPRAVHIAALSGLPLEAAQDCAQDAFIRAFKCRRQLRDPASFSLWFHRIVTRCVLDALKAHAQQREISLEANTELHEQWRDVAPSPDEAAILTEEREALWRQVQLLPSTYRVPLVLRYYGDFSVREVASLLGKRENTVRVLIYRALQQLRTRATNASTQQQLLSLRPADEYV